MIQELIAALEKANTPPTRRPSPKVLLCRETTLSPPPALPHVVRKAHPSPPSVIEELRKKDEMILQQREMIAELQRQVTALMAEKHITSEPRPPTCTAEPRPPTCTAEPRPPTCTAEPRPTTSTAEPGPATSTAEPGPPTSTAEPRPLTSVSVESDFSPKVVSVIRHVNPHDEMVVPAHRPTPAPLPAAPRTRPYLKKGRGASAMSQPTPLVELDR
jgi:hypothetical protein